MLSKKVILATYFGVVTILCSSSNPTTFTFSTSDPPESLLQKAGDLFQSNRLVEAIGVLQVVSQNHVELGSAHLNLGLIAQMEENYDVAIPAYERLLAVEPTNADGLNNLANCYSRVGRNTMEVVALYTKALEARPDHEIAGRNLGLTYYGLGDFASAEAAFAEHLSRRPDDAEAHYNLGVLYQQMGQVEAASKAYTAAVQLNPNYKDAWINLAAMHHKYGSLEEAIINYKVALELTPAEDFRYISMTYNNLGLAYYQSGYYRQAVEAHEYVLHQVYARMTGSSNNESVSNTEIHTLSHIYKANKASNQWAGWDAALGRLVGLVDRQQLGRGRPPALLPFDTLGVDQPDERWRARVARRHAAQWAGHYARQGFPAPPPPPAAAAAAAAGATGGGRALPVLRAGYLSYDFNDHPTTHLTEGLFLWHRRGSGGGGGRVEALVFSYGRDDGSAYRRRVEGLAAEFFNLIALGDDEAVGVVRGAGTHIAVDMQGWTLGARQELMAMRMAPVQVNYLVYPGRLAAPWADYLVADKWVAPLEAEGRLQAEAAAATAAAREGAGGDGGALERLALLPRCYQVNYYARHLAELEGEGHPGRERLWRARAALRREQGLPAGAFVFCNFNKHDKLEPEVFSAWLAVLRRVPGSVLWLLRPRAEKGGDLVVRHLRWGGGGRRVAPGRLRFAARRPKGAHLRRLLAADLALDTWVYGAHSTATDALRAGLPHLTLLGPAFPARVGASLAAALRPAGGGGGEDALGRSVHESLVTHSKKEFEDLAVSLATSRRGVLEELRFSLIKEADRAVLFDTEGYTRTLERAYMLMWEVYSLSS
ncbi:unnamed protein product, partial [Heterosigma akashiwo]